MPASPALAPGAGSGGLARASARPRSPRSPLAPAALAADRELTVSARRPAGWQGRAALTCGVRPGHAGAVRDARRRRVRHDARARRGPGTLCVELARSRGTADVDLYVYRSDAFGLAGPLVAVATGAGPGRDRRRARRERQLPRPRRVVRDRHEWVRRPRHAGAPPGRDPRRRSSARPSGGARQRSRTAPPRSPRWRSARATATCSSPPTASSRATRTSSRIATAVSFDRGRHWEALGAVSDALGRQPGGRLRRRRRRAAGHQRVPGSVVLRRWTRPERRDVRRDRTWEPPAVLSARRDGRASGARPRSRRRARLLGAHDRSRRLRPPGGAVPASPDAGVTWGAESQPSPATVPTCPTARTSAASRSPAGAAGSRRVGGHAPARSTARPRRGVGRAGDGGSWARPCARLASARSPSASPATASATSRCSRSPRRAGGCISPTRRRRRPGSCAPDAWEQPVTIAAGAFQPSIAAARADVYVSFLDRRLAAPFVDEWLATSDDRGRSWEERRLSHDSWDPAIGAPQSPTGELLGDHQALAADRCGAVALAADPHLANAWRRDRDFDHGARGSDRPQLFAWIDRRCD